MAAVRQKITPFLWFDDNAEEAIEHYCSIFQRSKVVSTSRYGEGAPFPKGTLMTATFSVFSTPISSARKYVSVGL